MSGSDFQSLTPRDNNPHGRVFESRPQRKVQPAQNFPPPRQPPPNLSQRVNSRHLPQPMNSSQLNQGRVKDFIPVNQSGNCGNGVGVGSGNDVPTTSTPMSLFQWVKHNQNQSFVFNFCPNTQNQAHRCSIYCLQKYGDPQKKVVIQPLPPITQ